jgi:hypothetical protein
MSDTRFLLFHIVAGNESDFSIPIGHSPPPTTSLHVLFQDFVLFGPIERKVCLQVDWIKVMQRYHDLDTLLTMSMTREGIMMRRG